MPTQQHVCIVGLGYVGLPLAHALAAAGHDTYGYDINEGRIQELQSGHDRTDELTDEQLQSVSMTFSSDPSVIGKAQVIILAIPTPIDDENNPDLKPLIGATETVGKHLKKGTIVVFESTVAPGTTEEICGPILEQESGLVCGQDFTLGYSPERINPGDKEHTIDRIMKIVSGQDDATTDELCELYGSVVKVGVHRAPNMKVAEMAKAIENAQRDLNIAFVNEIAILCNAIGIETQDVLKAAGTKWNFLGFQPGLVGGHCIGVDPYYLVDKANQLGMTTHVIAAGRSVNDSMPKYVANRMHEALGKKSSILVLGLTFKENVPDTRNSKASCVARELMKLGHDVLVHDPHVSVEEIVRMKLVAGELKKDSYDAVALLVPHKAYVENGIPVADFVKEGGLVYDLKSVLKPVQGKVFKSL